MRGAVGNFDVNHSDRTTGRLSLVGLDIIQGGKKCSFWSGERASPVQEYTSSSVTKCRHLVFRQELASGQRGRALERRRGVTQPDPLQIRPTVRESR